MRRPAQIEIEESDEPSPIDHNTIDIRHKLSDAVGDVVDRSSIPLQHTGLNASTATFSAPDWEPVERVCGNTRRGSSSESWTEAAIAANEDKRIQGPFSLFIMRDKRAPLFQQASDPQL